MKAGHTVVLFLGLTFGACAALPIPVGAADEAQGPYRFSLEDVTKMALIQNFDIQLAKYDTWISRTNEGVAKSIYDVILEAEVKYRDDQSQNTSSSTGTQTRVNDYNVGLSKQLPTGTTVGVDLTNNRTSTDSSMYLSSLTHDSSLAVTLEQDLGKNFFGLQDRGNVKITLLNIENAEYTTLDKIEDSVAQVQKTYWDLALQKERVKIEEAMVEEAKKLFDLHQEKLKDGLVELPEAIASEANYKSRKNVLLLARNLEQAKANALGLLLNLQENVTVETTEEFSLSEGEEDLVSAMKAAFLYRQDYQKAVKDIKMRELELTMDRNGLWPQINLTATLARNGLGDHFKQAVTQITDENNPDLSIGMKVTYPLENRAARGAVQASELEKAKAIVALKLLERKIAVSIADQVRDCRLFRILADNTRDVALLQEKKLAEEQARFRHGRSSTDTLIRFQEDLVQARMAVAEAVYRHNAARIDLKKKEGILLRQYWEGDL